MAEIRPDIGVAAGQVLSQGRVDAFLQGVSEPGSLVRELRRLRAENARLQTEIDGMADNYVASVQRRDVLQAERDRLNAAATTILRCSRHPLDTCPHGNRPSYPTHAWWCDGCFGALEDALLSPQAAELPCPTIEQVEGAYGKAMYEQERETR